MTAAIYPSQQLDRAVNAALGIRRSTMQASRHRTHALDALHLLYTDNLTVHLEGTPDGLWRCLVSRAGQEPAESSRHGDVCLAVCEAILGAKGKGWLG